MSDILLSRENQLLASKIVLIDGFSSSGKSLLCSTICSLDKAENWQIDYSYEQLATLYYLEKISIDSVRSILETRSDELIYNLFIGRNVNFRKTDLTSPYFNNQENKYIQRLDAKEGDEAVDKILRTKPILPLHIHFIFGYSNILLRAFHNKLTLYVVMLRDPFYLISRWDEGKWVNRMGIDNRDFRLCINYKNNIIPWYAKEYASEYIEANDAEKCFLTIYNLYKRIFSMYENLNQEDRKKVMMIFFDEFVRKPDDYVNKICKILNTTRSKDFQNFMNKSNLPRKTKNQITSIDEFKNKYSKKLRPHFLDLSLDLNDNYIKFYNLIMSHILV